MRHFTISEIHFLILNLMAATCLRNVGTGPCCVHCVASPLLLATSGNIWNWGDQLLDFWEEYCPVPVWLRIIAALQSWVFFVVFEMFSGQCSTWTLLLRSRAVGKDAGCGLTLSWWNMQGLPWRRRVAVKPFSIHWWSLSRCAGYQFYR